jgi:hypothetical protein
VGLALGLMLDVLASSPWMLAEAWVKFVDNLFRPYFGQGIRTVMTTDIGIIDIDSIVGSWSRKGADGMTSVGMVTG